MDDPIIKQFEREFFLVWTALDRVGRSVPHSDLLYLEVQRASDTLLRLMRASGCIDPTTRLDGSTAPEAAYIAL